MAVQAAQAHTGGVHHSEAGPLGGAGGEREAELLVLVAGGDELVGVDVHAGLDADEDVLGHTEVGGDLREASDLLDGVDDDELHTGADGHGEEGLGLVVAVHGDALGRETGGQCDLQLALAGDVEGQALVGDPAGDGDGQEGLRGVVDVLAATECGGETAAASPEVRLVHDEDRGAVLGDELGDRDTAQFNLTGRPDPGVRGEHVGREGVEVLQGRRALTQRDLGQVHLGIHGHILSGAETPTMRRALARVTRAAFARARRARKTGAMSSPVASSPLGRIWQES